MAAETSACYDKFQEHMAKALIHHTSDTIKVLYTSSTHTIDKANHDFKDDLTNEVSGTGYTAGGQALANKTIGTTAAVTKFDADDVSIPGVTVTVRQRHVYKDTGTAATSPLISFGRLASDLSAAGGNLDWVINANGIWTLTNSAEA